MHGDTNTDSISHTHLNAPGLQLLFCSSQVKGDGCTGIVNPEDCEDLAIVQLCKQTKASVGLLLAPLWRGSELKAPHFRLGELFL